MGCNCQKMVRGQLGTLVFLAERPLAHPAFCRGGWCSGGFPSLGLCGCHSQNKEPLGDSSSCSRDGRAPTAFPLGEVWDFFWDLTHIPSSCLSLQLIDRATSPRDDGDPKAEQKTLEESWQDLALIKATQKPPKRQRREDLSEPLLPPAPPPAPGDARGRGAGLHGWMKITLMLWGRLSLCSRLPGSTTLFLALWSES